MRHLLIVAGDRALTKFIAETLLGRKLSRANPATTGNGWDIARAHTALEAFLLLTKSGRRFDVLLLDQALPDKDVLKLLEELRGVKGFKDLPIILMCERGRDQLARRLASHSYLVAGFIDKPVTAETLRNGLRDLDRTRRILLVEKKAEKAEQYANALKKAGYAVDTVQNAKSCIEAVAASRPDAVVIALSLQDVPGAVLCQDLKKSASLNAIPVLLHGSVEELSAVEIEENAYRADDFLREPFDERSLVERVATLVGRGITRTGSLPPESEDTLSELATDGPKTDRGAAVNLKQEAPSVPAPPPAASAAARDAAMASAKRPTVDSGPPASKPERADVHAAPTGGTVDLGRRSKEDAESSPSSPPASASPAPGAHTKRATRRVPCNLSVSIRDGGEIYKSETLNISNGGILIATDHPIEMGTHIDLTLELPNSDKPITAVGKVAWVSRARGSPESAPSYGVGVKFSRIDPADLQRIVDYVNTVSRVVYVAP